MSISSLKDGYWRVFLFVCVKMKNLFPKPLPFWWHWGKRKIQKTKQNKTKQSKKQKNKTKNKTKQKTKQNKKQNKTTKQQQQQQNRNYVYHTPFEENRSGLAKNFFHYMTYMVKYPMYSSLFLNNFHKYLKYEVYEISSLNTNLVNVRILFFQFNAVILMKRMWGTTGLG